MAASTVNPITNTTDYPVYASKAAFLADLVKVVDGVKNREQTKHVLFRLSNTDTDNWSATSTARHDD
jgi:hypothetical protein